MILLLILLFIILNFFFLFFSFILAGQATINHGKTTSSEDLSILLLLQALQLQTTTDHAQTPSTSCAQLLRRQTSTWLLKTDQTVSDSHGESQPSTLIALMTNTSSSAVLMLKSSKSLSNRLYFFGTLLNF